MEIKYQKVCLENIFSSLSRVCAVGGKEEKYNHVEVCG